MQFDTEIIVVGGGVIGLAAAESAARSGKSVVLVEQHFPGTQQGSSAGHMRFWRTMYDEIKLSLLAYRSGDLYADLERETGSKLLYRHGLLNFGEETDYTPEGTLLAPVKTLKALDKEFRLLDKNEIEREYGFRDLPEHYVGIYQADNAVTDVKMTIQVLAGLCSQNHVQILPRRRVIRIDSLPGSVAAILSDGSRITARKAILALGPYTNELLRPSFGFELNLHMWDMCSAYYRIDGTIENYAMWYQFERPKNGYSNLFYGYPPVNFGRPGFVNIGLGWASHTFSRVSQSQCAPPRIDLEIVRDFVRDHMCGVDSTPIDASRAIAVHLPDNGCLLDYLPENISGHQNVVVCAAGWAFKFAPLFGRLCADLALEREFEEDIESLSISRPNRISAPPLQVDLANVS
jgi:sarcosine oxidase / L-pipecolate oxidase